MFRRLRGYGTAVTRDCLLQVVAALRLQSARRGRRQSGVGKGGVTWRLLWPEWRAAGALGRNHSRHNNVALRRGGGHGGGGGLTAA